MGEQEKTTQLLEQLSCKLDKIIYLLEDYFAPKELYLGEYPTEQKRQSLDRGKL